MSLEQLTDRSLTREVSSVVMPSLNRALEMCESRVYKIYHEREGYSPIETHLKGIEMRNAVEGYRRIQELINWYQA